MKNIELLELEGKLQNPIMEFLLEHDNHDSYLEKEHIDAILSKGESGLADLRLILKTYNQRYQNFSDYGGYRIFMVNVILGLAELEDDTVYQDIITYFSIDSDMVSVTWDDCFYESLPLYFAKFPNKIDSLRDTIFNTNLNYELKSIIIIGFSSIPFIEKRKDLYPVIANILLDYLEYLYTYRQNINLEEQQGIDVLFRETIVGYLNCGGDIKNNLVQKSFDDNLVNLDIYSEFEFKNWKVSFESFMNIYEFNSRQKQFIEEDRQFRTEMLQNKEREKLIENSKQFKKIFDRNDKISVKYKADGNILKDIKYKKVEDDLISGKCELI